MRYGALIAAVVAASLGAQVGLCEFAVARSPEIVEAFSELDRLREELAERRRELGEVPANSTTPALDMSDDAASSEEVPGGVGDAGGGVVACVSRQEVADLMGGLDERYKEHGEAIVQVNGELPAFREKLLDAERVCSPDLESDISAGFARVETLELEADRDLVDELTICVDRLRHETDEQLSATTNNIRMQRLAAEMERLGSMTHRVTNLERALLRGISKRGRLLEELGQFRQEIEVACR